MSIGKSQGYYSILLRKAIDAGIISRVGVTYRYRVLSPAPATHGGKRKGAGRKVKKHKSKPSQKAKPQKDKPTLVASKPEAA